MEKVAFEGWPNCYRLGNGRIELIVTTDIGPRVIHFGFVDGQNEFATVAEDLGKIGGAEWRIYGGHRLWHAPEAQPRTYYPDNNPVKIESHEGVIRLTQPPETTTGLQKKMDILMFADTNEVMVIHRLRNHNMWPVALAPWALSVMAPGGTAVLPLPPRGTHGENLLPNTRLNLWAYTDMGDPRWVWGEKYILLHQEPGNARPQKVGGMVTDGWVAYVRDGRLFLKTFEVQPEAIYPDANSNVELFTNDFMLEVETLGPMTNLAPGAELTHTERWHLFADVPSPSDDTDVETHILPKIKSIL